MKRLQFVGYLVLYFWTSPAQAEDLSFYESYLSAEISTCELINLQSYWKLKTPQETKIAIGKKVMAKQELLNDIVSARKHTELSYMHCDFWSLDFSYDDAVLMADFWGTNTYEAKLKIAQKVDSSSQHSVKQMIKRRTAEIATITIQETEPIQLFFQRGYQYCHAKMLGKAYGKDTYETKIWMGKLLKTDNQKLVEQKLSYARKEAQRNPANTCQFSDTDFNSKDAEKLATMWSLTKEEAKTALVDKYLYGIEKETMKMLRSVSVDPIQVYFENGFDYCHAKMIGKVYDRDTYETKIWMGEILNQGSKQVVEQKLSFARELAQRNPNNACQFSDTDFNSKDAKKLATMWNLTKDEAKTTLVNKYLYGIEKETMKMLR